MKIELGLEKEFLSDAFVGVWVFGLVGVCIERAALQALLRQTIGVAWRRIEVLLYQIVKLIQDPSFTIFPSPYLEL